MTRCRRSDAGVAFVTVVGLGVGLRAGDALAVLIGLVVAALLDACRVFEFTGLGDSSVATAKGATLVAGNAEVGP